MFCVPFPVIDPVATGENIRRLRQARGLSVRDLQTFFGFEEPRAIYKWQSGQTLPSIDNLYALGALLGVSMEDILVSTTPRRNIIKEQQAERACCSNFIPSAVRTAAETRVRENPFYRSLCFLPPEGGFRLWARSFS